MSEYYIAYEESVPWNGTVFNANDYRRAINSFYSKVDLVQPNAIVEDGAPTPNISRTIWRNQRASNVRSDYG